MKYAELIKSETIDLKNQDHMGILSWVKDFLIAYHTKQYTVAKKIKKNIDREIKRLKLNRHEFYFYFGDIDNPLQKKQVLKNIGIIK